MGKQEFRTILKSLKKHNIQKNKMKEQHGPPTKKIMLMYENQEVGALGIGGSVRLVAIISAMRAVWVAPAAGAAPVSTMQDLASRRAFVYKESYSLWRYAPERFVATFP